MRDKLSNVIDIISGGTPKTSEERFWNGDIGWLSLVDFGSKNKYVETSEKTITQEGVDNSSTKVLQENDIIISARGTVGAMAMLRKPMAFNQSCFGLRAKPQYLNQDYLFYYLKYYMKSIKAKVQGSVFDTINLSTFDMLEIEYPQMCIQNGIANILGAIDNKIENNNKINVELELMAKTIYNYWFLQFEFPNEEGKPYKSSGEKMVWNEELKREIPESWEKGTFSDLFEIGNGKDHKHLHEGTIPVYGSGGIMRYCDTPIFEGESVLIPRKGTLNNLIYVNGAFWTVDTMFYSKMKIDHAAIYAYYSLKRFDFELLNTGTGVPSMTSTIIYSLKTMIPNRHILEAFDKMVQPLYQQIKKNNIENMELSSLKDFLLPLLMNGQIVLDK